MLRALLGWEPVAGGSVIVDGRVLGGPDGADEQGFADLRSKTLWVTPATVGPALGGERADRAALVVMDEALRGTTPADRDRLLDGLLAAAGSATVLHVTHEPGDLDRFDRVVVIGERTVIADGSPRDAEVVAHLGFLHPSPTHPAVPAADVDISAVNGASGGEDRDIGRLAADGASAEGGVTGPGDSVRGRVLRGPMVGVGVAAVCFGGVSVAAEIVAWRGLATDRTGLWWVGSAGAAAAMVATTWCSVTLAPHVGRLVRHTAFERFHRGTRCTPGAAFGISSDVDVLDRPLVDAALAALTAIVGVAAALVLALTSRAWALAAVLVVSVIAMAALIGVYSRRRRRWSNTRLDLTDTLIGRLSDQRVEAVFGSVDDPAALDRYHSRCRRLDHTQALLVGAAPHVALLGMLVAYRADPRLSTLGLCALAFDSLLVGRHAAEDLANLLDAARRVLRPGPPTGTDPHPATPAGQPFTVPDPARDHHVLAPLASNVTIGRASDRPELADPDLAALLADLGLGGLIERMPDGLDQFVGDCGWPLSEGEKCRVAVARAIATTRPVTVAPHALDSLDPQRRRQVIDYLANHQP